MSDRIRLNLALTPAVRDRIAGLVESTGAESTTEVVRRAVAVYARLNKELAEGGRLVVRRADGSEVDLELLDY